MSGSLLLWFILALDNSTEPIFGITNTNSQITPPIEQDIPFFFLVKTIDIYIISQIKNIYFF